MKILKCSDVCCSDCGFVLIGNSERVLIRAMFLHGQREHKEIMKDLDDHSRQLVTQRMHAHVINQ